LIDMVHTLLVRVWQQCCVMHACAQFPGVVRGFPFASGNPWLMSSAWGDDLMTDVSTHIADLRQARANLVDARREQARRAAGQPAHVVMHEGGMIEKIQSAIEAVDRAIRDEETIAS
jgi:hypothetical protein